MRILKFKSQLTIAFFTAVNHLKEPLRKQNFTLTGSKGHGLWCVIGGFRSLLCVSVSRFVACDHNYDWRQQKTWLWRQLLNFRVRMSVKSAVTKCKIQRWIRLFSFQVSAQGSQPQVELSAYGSPVRELPLNINHNWPSISLFQHICLNLTLMVKEHSLFIIHNSLQKHTGPGWLFLRHL